MESQLMRWAIVCFAIIIGIRMALRARHIERRPDSDENSVEPELIQRQIRLERVGWFLIILGGVMAGSLILN